MKFKKKDRLVSEEDFSKVFRIAHNRSEQKKTILHLDPFIIYRTASNEAPRLGLSVSRKVVRRAHDRNRIKRIIREYFRIHKTTLRGDFVIRVVQNPIAKSYAKIEAVLKSLNEGAQ